MIVMTDCQSALLAHRLSQLPISSFLRRQETRRGWAARGLKAELAENDHGWGEMVHES